jgi:hypothetical protein
MVLDFMVTKILFLLRLEIKSMPRATSKARSTLSLASTQEPGSMALTSEYLLAGEQRASSTDVSYYVINKSSVAGTTSSTAGTGTVYLGRPWSEYARVDFQNTVLGAIINSAGWEQWSSSEPNTEDLTFQEYGNTGTGASGTRASFSTELSSAVTISTILGSTYTGWVDTTYLS